MKSCLIIFSTTDGHTKKICDQIFNILSDSHKIKILNLSSAFFEDLSNYNLIIVGASIRYGKHKKELYEFIRKIVEL
jgi:menaquinone-dependent protoporphyrinogen oxidase